MKLATIALVVAYAALPAYALAETAPIGAPSAPSESTLVIAGDATVEREPDSARLSAEIVTTDDNASRSAGKNATIYEALKAKLTALGIASDAIRTTSFNANFVPRPTRPQPVEYAQRYGFVTTRSLSIAVSPIGAAGKIVDASLAAGVTQVGDVAYELKDRKGAYRSALAAAFADARANATALVANSDVRIVRVREISTGSYAISPPRPYETMQMRAATSAPPTQIEPGGPIDVSARVTVTFVIRSTLSL